MQHQYDKASMGETFLLRLILAKSLKS